MRKLQVGAVTLLLISALIGLSPSTAAAAFSTNTTGGGTILTITGSSRSESLFLTCNGGLFKVNDHDPDDGPLACAALVELHVSMGAGDDGVDAQGIDGINSPNLLDIDFKLGDGRDTVGGTRLEEHIGGGPGIDTIGDVGSSAIGLTDDELHIAGSVDTLSSIEAGFFLLDDGDASLLASQFHGDMAVGGGTGEDIIESGSGDDIINGVDDDDQIDAGRGDDLVIPFDGSDVTDGGPGKDTILFHGDEDLTIGFDTATASSSTDIYVGFERAKYEGTNDPDTVSVVGFDGPVTLEGFEGNDTLSGGDFNDTIKGAQGADELNGEGGPDKIDGGPGADVCNGGAGKDTLTNC